MVAKRKNWKPIFSLEGLIEYSGGNKEFQKHVIDTFLQQCKTEMEWINNAIEREFFLQAAQSVHKLKSSLGLLNVDLSIANDFEEVLKENKNTNEIEANRDLFMNQLHQLNTELLNFLKTSE